MRTRFFQFELTIPALDRRDVAKTPALPFENSLTDLPAVFRTLPSLVRKFVGNWANEDHEFVGFNLITPDKPKPAKRSPKR